MPEQQSSLYQPDRDITRDELIASLAATPDRLRRLLASQPAEALTRKVGPDDWSAIEVARHIRDAVQVYGMRFKWMILQDDPFLPNYDENRWASGSPDGPAELPSMLDEIAAYRNETVRLLRALPAEDWSRRGRHEIDGSIELEPYVRHQLAHEEQHLAQLEDSLRD